MDAIHMQHNRASSWKAVLGWNMKRCFKFEDVSLLPILTFVQRNVTS
jgi:hypothetical protein